MGICPKHYGDAHTKHSNEHSRNTLASSADVRINIKHGAQIGTVDRCTNQTSNPNLINKRASHPQCLQQPPAASCGAVGSAVRRRRRRGSASALRQSRARRLLCSCGPRCAARAAGAGQNASSKIPTSPQNPSHHLAGGAGAPPPLLWSHLRRPPSWRCTMSAPIYLEESRRSANPCNGSTL